VRIILGTHICIRSRGIAIIIHVYIFIIISAVCVYPCAHLYITPPTGKYIYYIYYIRGDLGAGGVSVLGGEWDGGGLTTYQTRLRKNRIERMCRARTTLWVGVLYIIYNILLLLLLCVWLFIINSSTAATAVIVCLSQILFYTRPNIVMIIYYTSGRIKWV